MSIPEHYVPTSTHPNWKGKIRCAYCKHSGWPIFGTSSRLWTNRHGANCAQRPVVEA